MKTWSWYFGQNETRPLPGSDEPPKTIPDAWWEKLVKGVPAEVVGAYAALIAFLKIPGGVVPLIVGFALGLAGTFAAMTVLRDLAWTNVDKKLQRIARIQIVVAMLAFTAWAYGQGGFFALWTVTVGSGDAAKTYTIYQDWVAGVVVVVMGFIIVLSDKITHPNA